MKEAIENVIRELRHFAPQIRDVQQRGLLLNLAAYMHSKLSTKEIDAAYYVFMNTYRRKINSRQPEDPQLMHFLEQCYKRLTIFGPIKQEDHRTRPGTAIIHRIWVGKHPEENSLKSITAGNINISKIWHEFRAPVQRTVAVRQILWTDNLALISANKDSLMHNKLEVKDISELFSPGVQDNIKLLEPFVRSFIRRKEFAFASDILRYIIMFLFGGLYLDVSWKTMSNQAKSSFTPTNETVKLTFLFYPSGTSVNIPGLEKGEYYENFIRSIRKGTEVPGTYGAIDSNSLYVGEPRSVLIDHALDILLEILSQGSSAPDFPVALYRKYKAEAAKHFGDESVDKDLKMKVRGCEIGSTTNLYPIAQSLTDFGYIYMKSPLSNFKHFDLHHENRFEAKMSGRGYLQIPELGIERTPVGSWYKNDPKYKLSSED